MEVEAGSDEFLLLVVGVLGLLLLPFLWGVPYVQQEEYQNVCCALARLFDGLVNVSCT